MVQFSAKQSDRSCFRSHCPVSHQLHDRSMRHARDTSRQSGECGVLMFVEQICPKSTSLVIVRKQTYVISFFTSISPQRVQRSCQSRELYANASENTSFPATVWSLLHRHRVKWVTEGQDWLRVPNCNDDRNKSSWRQKSGFLLPSSLPACFPRFAGP